jgi:hypothetical protein
MVRHEVLAIQRDWLSRYPCNSAEQDKGGQVL